jgi:hypothetical protein
MLIAPSSLRSKYAAKLEFKATNNVAEYEGLILGLNKAKALGAKNDISKNRLSGCGWASKKRVHGTKARIGQILGNSKGTRTEVLGVHLEIHTKDREPRGR